MRRWIPTVVFLTLTAICGCAGLEDSVSTFLRTGPWWQTMQADEIGERARRLEQRGEWAMALDHWRLIEWIAVDGSAARREINRLAGRIDAAVKSHYRNGLEKMGRSEPEAARNQFLAALRLDPAFQPARQQIKASFSPFPLMVHRSVAGDRPATVAQAVYGDAGKAFLVAWFNDLPNDAVLTPDTLLILPKIEKPLPKKVSKKRTFDHLKEARARLAADDLDGALALARKGDPVDPAAQTLIHAILLKQATAQTQAGNLDGAGITLTQIPDGFPGKADAGNALQAALGQAHAAEDLKKAQVLLDRQDYRQSLDLAEAVHLREPQNSAAQALADEARYRLAQDHADHQRWIMAREVLEAADERHPASMALKKTVQTRLEQWAQIHYRRGVKHYLNEDLKAAVAEWEQALIYNPDHLKARENIENARRLMQKLKTLP